MTTRVTDIRDRIRHLEHQLERELSEKRREWHYRLESSRVRFEHNVREQHRRLRTRVPRFVREASLATLLTAPVIYSGIIPFVLLDLWCTLYQSICFPAYGIPRVTRSSYFVIDRHHLAYLNIIEKLNCLYCSYAIGLLSYVSEIAGRTEQYWCPIKHATRVRTPHERYHLFVDYGDAEGYHHTLPRLRKAFDDVGDMPRPPVRRTPGD